MYCIEKLFLSLLKQTTGIELYGVAYLVPKETSSVLSAAGRSPERLRPLYADMMMYAWSITPRERDHYLFVRPTTSTAVSKGRSR